jgi:hypothetical protein
VSPSLHPPRLLDRVQALYQQLLGHAAPMTWDLETVLASLAAGCDEIIVELPNSLDPEDVHAPRCQIVLRGVDSERGMVALVVPRLGLGSQVRAGGAAALPGASSGCAEAGASSAGSLEEVEQPLALPVRAVSLQESGPHERCELALEHLRRAFASGAASALLPPRGFAGE